MRQKMAINTSPIKLEIELLRRWQQPPRSRNLRNQQRSPKWLAAAHKFTAAKETTPSINPLNHTFKNCDFSMRNTCSVERMKENYRILNYQVRSVRQQIRCSGIRLWDSEMTWLKYQTERSIYALPRCSHVRFHRRSGKEQYQSTLPGVRV